MDWLSFVIGALAGWIVEWLLDLFYWRRKYLACRQEQEELRARLTEVEKRLRTYQVKGWEADDPPQHAPSLDTTQRVAFVPPMVDLDAEPESPEVSLSEPAAEVPPPAPAPANNLELLEGIGPKIARVLYDHDILTFARLADTSVEQLEAILRAAGPNFRLADPTTWPQQARLAAAGDWDELHTLQQRLAGGRGGRWAGE